MTVGSFFQSLGPGIVPEWIHLVPAGRFSTNDGRGTFYLRDAQSVIRASMAASRLPVDINHSTDYASPLGLPAPAVGWIVEMQQRSDGIWGRVDWSTDGRALLEQRAYRGVSPVFVYSTDGEITKILRAALTNIPALDQLVSVNSRHAGISDTPRYVGPVLTANDLAMCFNRGIPPLSFLDRLKTNGPRGGMRPEDRAWDQRQEPPDNSTYGLSAKEQLACQRAKVSFRDYSEARKNGRTDPLFSTLPSEARERCYQLNKRPSEYAIWYYTDRVTQAESSGYPGNLY